MVDLKAGWMAVLRVDSKAVLLAYCLVANLAAWMVGNLVASKAVKMVD